MRLDILFWASPRARRLGAGGRPTIRPGPAPRGRRPPAAIGRLASHRSRPPRYAQSPKANNYEHGLKSPHGEQRATVSSGDTAPCRVW